MNKDQIITCIQKIESERGAHVTTSWKQLVDLSNERLLLKLHNLIIHNTPVL